MTHTPRPLWINNLPVKTLVHKDLTIEGYSRAAVQTYWRIPELKFGFDLGAQPWSFMGTPTWFVSHTHMDHLVGAAGLRGAAADDEDGAADDLSARGAPSSRCSGSCGCSAGMDRGRLPCTLLPITAGRRDRAFARARGHRLGHDAHGAVAGLCGLGAAAEAQAGVPWPAGRADPRSAACRHRSDRRGPHAAAGLPGRQFAGRAGRLPGDVSRPKC